MDFSLIITIVYGASYALVVIITSIYCAWELRQRKNETNAVDITTTPKDAEKDAYTNSDDERKGT